ncbi:MAG: DUF4157 domain-containing protein, partial [Rhodoferax sp.]|nr:DUF4157 domain-containing protein [Rhodoferax sp.]
MTRCSCRAARTASSQGLHLPDAVASALRGAGQPLHEDTRAFMEQRFGHDFGPVRLHTGSAATQAARQMAARAFTVGQHIVLGPGIDADAMESTAGRSLLAHELAHAVQQRGAGGADLSPAQREHEARGAAAGIDGTAPMPRISAASPALSRDPEPGAGGDDDAGFEASLAEASCDIASLCRLSFRAPATVTPTRLLQAYHACHPGVSLVGLVGGNPCLTPNYGLPATRPGPVAPGPRRAPGAATPAG